MFEEAGFVLNDVAGSIRIVASFCAKEKVMKMRRRQRQGLLNAKKSKISYLQVRSGLSIAAWQVFFL